MSSNNHWRGVLEWQSQNIPMTTTSNEACKMYDATLTQLVGWYDEPSVGGIDSSIRKMIAADPDFVMGQCLSIGLDLAGTGRSPRLDQKFKQEIENLDVLAAKSSSITERELKHVEAIKHWAKGDIKGAARDWEDILCEYPTDMHALKMAHDSYFFSGELAQIRDSLARVMPFWQSGSIPLKSYLHGMYAFGLEETNFYRKAEAEARKGIEMNKNDGWATHALAHVLEMECRTDEGIETMSKTEEHWSISNHLACHNYWHWALYHIEKGDYEAAFEILNNHIIKRARENGTMLDMVDLSSLLFRFKLTDPSPRINNDHWDVAINLTKDHLNDHLLGFNDAHFMMACVGGKQFDMADELLGTLGENEEHIPGNGVVRPLLQAILAFGREKYADVVDHLMPIRYDVVKMGGSGAQRDVFHQLLIVAAIKSKRESHRKLAQMLLIEREKLKENAPLTNRMVLTMNQNE